MSTTDTPRTDAAIAPSYSPSDFSYLVATCRQLERELAIELERATHYRDEWQKSHAELTRLRSALHSCLAATGDDAGDIDDFRALENAAEITVSEVKKLRAEVEQLRGINENAVVASQVIDQLRAENAALAEAHQCDLDRMSNMAKAIARREAEATELAIELEGALPLSPSGNVVWTPTAYARSRAVLDAARSTEATAKRGASEQDELPQSALIDHEQGWDSEQGGAA